MRRKLLVSLVSVCALVGVLVGPASASASKLTLTNVLGEPASTAKFHANTMTVSSGLGSWNCEGFDLSTAITKNSANPVTLNVTGGTLGTCKTAVERNLTYSEFESTAPMTLKPDGTGTLPIRAKEVYTDKGTVLWTCKREGTLNLTKTLTSPLQFSFSGELKSGGCGVASLTWSGTFGSVKDEFGSGIGWSVPPTLDNASGVAASKADFWDADPIITNAYGKFVCEEFKLQTTITKNEANPVTLQSSGTSTLTGCKSSGGTTIKYSGIETTAAMTLYANKTGSLPIRLSESSGALWSCVRQGTLTLGLNPLTGDVSFSGSLSKISGTEWCPASATIEGVFTRSTDENGADIQWVGFS